MYLYDNIYNSYLPLKPLYWVKNKSRKGPANSFKYLPFNLNLIIFHSTLRDF